MEHQTGYHQATLGDQVDTLIKVIRLIDNQHNGFETFLLTKSALEGLGSLEHLAAYLAGRIWQAAEARQLSPGSLVIATFDEFSLLLAEMLQAPDRGSVNLEFVGATNGNRQFSVSIYSNIFDKIPWSILDYSIEQGSKTGRGESFLFGITARFENLLDEDVVENEWDDGEEKRLDLTPELLVQIGQNLQSAVAATTRHTAGRMRLALIPGFKPELNEEIILERHPSPRLLIGYAGRPTHIYPLADEKNLAQLARFWQAVTRHYMAWRGVCAPIWDSRRDLLLIYSGYSEG